ncbi:MAG: cupin domain-containing protein [Treponema sp.]|nr:cupin domain-containing protein [Treponema sp.]
MEIIKKSEIKILSNPGVESFQLLNPENSKSERITITRVLVQPNNEQPRHKHDTSEQIWIAVNGKGILLLADNKEEVFENGDVVRFADGDIHGLKNNSQDVFEYISVTSPPINFGYAYKKMQY